MNNIFQNILKGKLLVIGIGNILKSDDALGPELVKRLKGIKEVVSIDAGTAPENYTGKIIKENPDVILIVDAMHLEKKPGSYEILTSQDIEKRGFTTHDISPNMFMEYLKNNMKSEIFMLGIQPKNISFGEEISVEVKETLQKIENMIKEIYHA